MKKLFFCVIFVVGLNAKIYDCFTFFNELELLSMRLEELDPVVDYFVLVEGTQTFTGVAKPLYFLENRSLFQPYLHKIIHVIVDDFPFINNWMPLQRQPWKREIHQRNAMLRGLIDAEDTDIVIATDVDEIPRREAVLSAKNLLDIHDCDSIVVLEMLMFRYQLNRLDKVRTPWRMGSVAFAKTIRQKTANQLRGVRSSLKLANAGWHFTSQGGSDLVVTKLSSYSHAFDRDIIRQRERIQENFDEVKAPFATLSIDDTWPERVKRLKSEYEAMGWIAR